MTNTLTFDKGVAELDLDTLKRTAKYELAKGALPTARPVEHGALLDALTHIASLVPGISLELDKIYAAESMAMRVMYQGDKNACPIENYLLQRLTARIDLSHSSDTDFNMAIGVAYNEKGISLAFGTNVRVCSNQNIFGENIMHTFGGDRKVPFDKMIEVFGKWMLEFNKYRDNDYELIEKMKRTEIEGNAKQILYGKLIDKAVVQNMDSKVKAPLNITQVADFIRTSYSPEYKVADDKLATVWDMQQMGTAILKPKTTDMVSLLESQNNFSNFIVNEFNLN